jgi:hypothetical protein
MSLTPLPAFTTSKMTGHPDGDFRQASRIGWFRRILGWGFGPQRGKGAEDADEEMILGWQDNEGQN